MSKIKVSQKLSLIGKTKKQIACIKGLGLKRISDTKILDDTPENLGMINVVKHMLDVEYMEEQSNVKWDQIKKRI